MSYAVQRIVARRLEPPPATQSDEVKWKTFLASVDNDLNLYLELREAVRKVKQESVLHFDLVPIPGGRKMFIFIHDRTISFSDVDKTKVWRNCLSKHDYTTEEISGNQKEDDRCNTLISYFRLIN